VIRPLRWLFLGLIAAGLSSCSAIRKIIVGPPGPPLEQYRLILPVTEDGASATPGPAVLSGTLGIAPYITRGIYDDPGIVFRINDVQLRAYPSKEWAIPLRDMLGDATETMLRRSPLTAEAGVFDPSRRSQTSSWRGTVREFEEVDRGNRVLVAVHLEAQIVLSATDSVVWSGSHRVERAVTEPTTSMERVVEGLSAATADVLSVLIQRARAELSGRAAASVARPPE
jgi:uncharacterized lipoprotein YmbA